MLFTLSLDTYTLTLYLIVIDIPVVSASTKCKLTATCDGKTHSPKRPRRSKSTGGMGDSPSENPFRFHSVGTQWQQNACNTLGVTYEKPNGVSVGGGDVPLTRPDTNVVKKIAPDGNCMFRSLSYIVTGSEEHHDAIRAKIVEHAKHSPSRLLQHIKGNSLYRVCTSVSQYMQKSKMDRDGVWDTEIELLCFVHLTKTCCVLSYSIDNGKWNRYGPHDLDRHLNVQSGTPAVYLLHPHGHYDVVIQTETVGLANIHNTKSKAKIDEKPLSISRPKRACSESGWDESPKAFKNVCAAEDGKNCAKQPLPVKADKANKATKTCPTSKSEYCTVNSAPTRVWLNYHYNPVNEQWQRSTSDMLGLTLHGCHWWPKCSIEIS